MLSGQGPVIVSRLNIEGSVGAAPASVEQDITREIVPVVLIKVQTQEVSRGDGYERRGLIVDVPRTPASRLRFGANWFRELAAMLFHIAAKLRVNTERWRTRESL
jgi:hypothetical protein